MPKASPRESAEAEFWNRIGGPENYPNLTATDLFRVLSFWRAMPNRAGLALLEQHPRMRFNDVTALGGNACQLLVRAAEDRGLNSTRIQKAHAIGVEYLWDVVEKMNAMKRGSIWTLMNDFLDMCKFVAVDMPDKKQQSYRQGITEIGRLAIKLENEARRPRVIPSAGAQPARVDGAPGDGGDNEPSTDLQIRILEELAGHGMTAEALTGRLDKIGVKKDLRTVKAALADLKKRGTVKNKKGLGYYCPDSPPKPVTL